MGTIGALSGLYQLSSLLSSGSGSSLTSNSTGSTGSTFQTLEQILNSSGSGSSNNTDGYLLDLSPQAQQLMSGTSSSASGSSTTFTLTSAQQTQIENIIAQYKDAPLTQATFEEIEKALQAAGLSPEQLGAQDQVKSFNPTNVLLSALNGNYASIQTPATSASNEQTKETNYMQAIANLWKTENTSTSSASGSSGSGTVTTA